MSLVGVAQLVNRETTLAAAYEDAREGRRARRWT